MKTMLTMTNPVTNPVNAGWQLLPAAVVCATSALPTLASQGLAVRPAAPKPASAAFAAAAGTVAVDAKRERAIAGAGRTADAARVHGTRAWSPSS